jgi:looped-hinge helix DNA binding domain, AbrB family
MKATGIVRRIDDLGRVVIPKEIRRTMRIREGDPLEIFTDRDGEVIFKKYSPIGELLGSATQYAETLYKTCSYPIIICDRDTVVAFAGVSKKECADKKIASDIENIMESRQLYTYKDSGTPAYAVDGNDKFVISSAMPVISEGDIIGAVISIFPEGTTAVPNELEIKMIQTAAAFLGKQLEE